MTISAWLRMVGLLLGLAATTNIGLRAAELPLTNPQVTTRTPRYTPLVDSGQPPSFAAPDLATSREVALKGLAVELVMEAGPWFNRFWTSRKLSNNYEAAIDTALRDLRKTGQNGFLIRVEVLQEEVPAGEYYSLRGDGAVYLGSGATPESVCIRKKCTLRIDPLPSSRQSFAKHSGYHWFSRAADGKWTRGIYTLNTFNSAIFQLQANAELARATQDAARVLEFSSLASSLERNAKVEADRAAIQKIISERDAALTRQKSIETQLAKELERAEKARRLSANLQIMMDVLSIASAANMVYQEFGADPVAKPTTAPAVGGGPLMQTPTGEQLKKYVNDIEKSANGKITDLRVEIREMKVKIDSTERQMGDYTIKYEMQLP